MTTNGPTDTSYPIGQTGMHPDWRAHGSTTSHHLIKVVCMGSIDRAIRSNRSFAGRLGWDRHLGAIGAALGLEVRTSDDRALAEAIIAWQRARGLDDDGIIGPNTWRALSAELDVEPQVDDAPSGGAGGTAQDAINADRLGTWRDAEAATFRRSVYARQLDRNIRRGREAFPGLSDDELDDVEDGRQLVVSAAAACRELLAAVRADAPSGVTVTIGSAYRDPERDFRAWQNAFGTHYDRTADERAGLDGGAHGSAARDLMVARMVRFKAVPGFSNHTRGRAVDFKTDDDGTQLGISSAQHDRWLESWLHGWLLRRAAEFSFSPYDPEPWHWEHGG